MVRHGALQHFLCVCMYVCMYMKSCMYTSIACMYMSAHEHFVCACMSLQLYSGVQCVGAKPVSKGFKV
jgi:hypothetical protein